MLSRFAEDIWIANGPVVAIAGFDYRTRMAVIRLASGELFVWSPIALTPELMSQVNALGPVKCIVAPNRAHYLFAREWAEAYPQARRFGSPALLAKRTELGWHGALGDEPEPGWAGEIDQVVVRGNIGELETVFFHRASATVIFTDLIQHFGPTWFHGWRSLIARLDLMAAPEPEVPRKFRLAFIGSATARDAITRILQWPAQRVLFAHGEPITADGQAFLVNRFRWLKRRR